ncbi:MAG: plasmid mobilization relaxosome protein MobC [Mucilaginibacter sp.]
MAPNNKSEVNIIRNKGGRPEKAIKRNTSFVVRLTPTERLLIEGKAKEAGMLPTVWFRQAAKRAKIIKRLTPEDMRILRVLTGMANNLNQLTHLAHIVGLPRIEKHCAEILLQIDEAITYLNSDDRKSNDR